MSQDAAFYLDPLRDIYEAGVTQLKECHNVCIAWLTSGSGLYDLYLLPASDQFSRW